MIGAYQYLVNKGHQFKLKSHSEHCETLLEAMATCQDGHKVCAGKAHVWTVFDHAGVQIEYQGSIAHGPKRLSHRRYDGHMIA